MKRRSFLKRLGGVITGTVVSQVIPIEQGLDGSARPPRLSYLINNDTGLWQGLSRSNYPVLKSPVLDQAGSVLNISDIDAVLKKFIEPKLRDHFEQQSELYNKFLGNE